MLLVNEVELACIQTFTKHTHLPISLATQCLFIWAPLRLWQPKQSVTAADTCCSRARALSMLQANTDILPLFCIPRQLCSVVWQVQSRKVMARMLHSLLMLFLRKPARCSAQAQRLVAYTIQRGWEPECCPCTDPPTSLTCSRQLLGPTPTMTICSRWTHR